MTKKAFWLSLTLCSQFWITPLGTVFIELSLCFGAHWRIARTHTLIFGRLFGGIHLLS
jgi:hypothetical protein